MDVPPPMPITILDPSTALILVDTQKGLVGLPTVHPAAEVVARAADLATDFRRRALPVVLVNVAGGAPGRADDGRGPDGLPAEWTELVPELDAQASDILVSTRTRGAFAHTDLAAERHARGTRQVVIAGMTTCLGVESTARRAYELGFHVSLALDAMADVSREAHYNTIANIFPHLGETGSAQDVIVALHRA